LADDSWDALDALMTATKEVLGDPYPLTAGTLVGVASLWLPDRMGRNRCSRHHLICRP